ncbi:PAS domain-containing protein [Oscillospiraceae bacterium NSJ-54]|uniref:Stage 0 sporulation protein A homolog n=2 Tax=Zongyangia hominis TaxID=2763677 RepID=A0A926ECT0_9FIRM|nr:PAS domain-containing protein [Zongyangia hominis]
MVCALDSLELIYANRPAQELIALKSDHPLTCYHVMGFAQPCPFCKVGQMNRSSFYTREHYIPENGHTYQLSGKLIDWGGRSAHIEYIADITEKKRQEEYSKALGKQLEETFSSIPCGLCVYEVKGETIIPLFHNPAFFEIMGCSEQHIPQVKQEICFTGVHPQDLLPLQEKFQSLIKQGGVIFDTFRMWNERMTEYRWIRLEGTVCQRESGKRYLYAVYSDISEQMRLERELASANSKMEDIINAIPGGVAIYKVSDIFETKYFSDGVPELSGYTVEEYRELTKRDASEFTYPADTAMVVGRIHDAVTNHTVADFDFRKLHRDGHIVWVHVQAKQVGEEDGCPLVQCVFHNISALKETQLELDHLINSIPGGIASYLVEGERFIPTFFSDGVMELSGHTRKEYQAMVCRNALDIIYEPDRERVLAQTLAALANDEVLDVSYRMRHKNGKLIWIHLNGRRMGPPSDRMRFYAVFTGMSAETRLFQSIANETADGIYVIDKENYDLLYANDSENLFIKQPDSIGQKCYMALHGKSEPCEFCTLKTHAPDGKEHAMPITGNHRFYTTRFRETDWNGIPAYVKYVRDVTEEVETRKEKERLEQYFQTVVKNLPGGIAVIRYEDDGTMTPEYLSDGFAALTGMSLEKAWELYCKDAMAGVHPDDKKKVDEQMAAYIASGMTHCEIVYRLQGGGGYVWVKNTLSLIENEGGERRVYAVYHDMTKEREEQERIRQQYKEMLLQHYRAPDPNALVIGHCNITQNRILEIIDHTDSGLLETFGSVREAFFTGLASLIVDDAERQQFLGTYLNAPAMAAFQRNDTEQIIKCFVKLPKEEQGRYVQFKVNLVETPDTGDVTGILTVTDITEQEISDRILHKLSVTNYDFVIDLDLQRDTFNVLTCNNCSSCTPPECGCHSQRLAFMLEERVVPKDKEQYAAAMDTKEMYRRLTQGPYTFSFSIIDENGDIRTKNMTVSPIDMRLGRVCLVRTDITDSVREQQGLLNMIAYTFELAGFIDISTGSLTMYTHQTVLENLAPFIIEHYDNAIERFAECYGAREDREEVNCQFRMETMAQRLKEQPAGYDFVFPYQSEEGLLYKQINVLWGDQNHRTICLVRADVTDMLAAERQTKKALEKALSLAEEANQAKSDFLSAMSHDIRTPMNAIMGMTALAVAHLDDQERVADCLQKISVSSKHLLSLINDILDMSKIERSKITLSRMKISLSEMLQQISAIMSPQARASGVHLAIRKKDIRHPYFFGDSLRIDQILINILSNAVKFTPEGGQVDFLVEELPPVQHPRWARYRFTVKDNGIGMPDDFLVHIFEPFTRSRGATRVEGTGLGLSITKGLVDLMGGEISVESEPRQGTTFRVELECEYEGADIEVRQEEAFSSAKGAELETLFAGRLFLVAEDNAINAEILCELLSMYGASTVVKTDGAQAVQAFRESAPGTYDAILMDIQMPEMNGYESTRVIRAMGRPDARKIPIVAMTANAFAEDIQASVEAGMTAHVAKPIDVDLLRLTLSRVLECDRTNEG